MKTIFDSKPQIFTTGAFLQPAKIIDNNGKETWIWHVSEFIDDSFLNGGIYNPKEIARTKDDLLMNTTSDVYERSKTNG